jgi:preprotein translocase subunit YajC
MATRTALETMQFLLPLLLVLIFYFLWMRPMQRARAAGGGRAGGSRAGGGRGRGLLPSYNVGDRVVTIGGIVGRVVDESGDRLQLEVADGVVMEFLRMAINRRLDPGEDSGFVAGDGEESEETDESEESDENDEEVDDPDETEGSDESGEGESEEAAVSDDAIEPESAEPGSSGDSAVSGDDATKA